MASSLTHAVCPSPGRGDVEWIVGSGVGLAGALAETLSRKVLIRAQDFRWDTHVERLLALAQGLVSANPKQT